MVATAHAEGTSKGHGEGGRFAVYYPIIAKYNKSGDLFRIEGVCRSACTLFLGIRHVCVDRGATLSFHGGPDSKTRTRSAAIQARAAACSLRISRSSGATCSTVIIWIRATTTS
jgi:hypothetical protein